MEPLMTEMLAQERQKDQRRRLQKLARQQLHEPVRQNQRRGQRLFYLVGAMLVRWGTGLQAYGTVETSTTVSHLGDCC